jgi:hypothetical protein
MSNNQDPATPRREFLGQIAASAIVLAGTACAPPAAAAALSTAPAPSGSRASTAGQWDDSWFGRLTAKHKAVFDSPDVSDNTTAGFSHAQRYIQGMRDALGIGPNDAQTVVVVRHEAIPFAFNDAMWEKYKIGEAAHVNSGGAPATKNPAAHGRQPANANSDRPQSDIEWLTSHGHVVLACDLATQRLAGTLASKNNSTMKAVYEDLKANVAPGVILQPSGVYAVHRAQEAGCTFIRSS